MIRIAIMISLAALAWTATGCRPTTPTPPSPDHDTRAAPIRSDAQTLATITSDIQSAPDAIAEGAAIKRLQAWQAAHGTTFQMAATGVVSGVVVRDPSTRSEALREHITIFRGQQPIHEFTFVPRDNRNLALMGQ